MRCEMLSKFVLVLSILITVSAGSRVSGQSISDEARRHFDRGMSSVEMANSPDELQTAIAEFKQAAALAPNWPDAYFNLGKTLEAAERFAEAAAAFRDYVRVAPNSEDSSAVKSLINRLEFKAENTITAEKAVQIIPQLKSWKSTYRSEAFSYIQAKDATTIRVPHTVIWSEKTQAPDVFYREIKVTGPRTLFWFRKTLIDKNNAANYMVDTIVECEIVSPTKVRVAENQIWYYLTISDEAVRRVATYELSP